MDQKLELYDRYFIILALLLPISSFLLIPSVQGTTLGYLLSFFLFVFVAMFKGMRSDFYVDLFKISLVFLFITVASQWILGARSYVSLDGLRLVDESLRPIIMRPSMITQSIYLIPCFLLFIFVKNFYSEKWDKYLFRGAILLSIYGVYEFVYFFIFKDNGDFITNRTFGNGDHEGSLFQTYTVAGMALQRVKSLTGEPSMFALTILPFWIYSMHLKRKFLAIFFFVMLALSNSTTAFLGIGMYILLYMRYNFQSPFKMYAVFSLSFIGCVFIGIEKIVLFFQTNFGVKLSAQSVSGVERTMYMKQHIEYFMDMPVMSKIFGLGFGYARSTDFFSTLLVNTGIVGIVLFTLLFLYPVFRLGYSDKEIGLKCALIVLYVAMMISVPEFSYLSTWLFLGIAYYYVHKQKVARIAKDNETIERVRNLHAS